MSKLLWLGFLFFGGASLSGILSGVKAILGTFQRKSEEPGFALETTRHFRLVEGAAEAWRRPGFFEAYSFGRFIADGLATVAGTLFMLKLFPGMSWGLGGAWAILFSYLVGHWLLPSLAQAFSTQLGRSALAFHRVFFALFGRFGVLFAKARDTLLHRLGIEPRLDFLGDPALQKPLHAEEDERPDQSGLEDEEKEMIRGIFDMRDTRVSEVMTPRVEVVALSEDLSLPEVLEVIQREKFSRIPVYRESLDRVIGILHPLDLLGLGDSRESGSFRLADHVREAFFVPRTKKIDSLLREFRQRHIHLALVVDEYGGTTGLVTLEDILEEIVGEIHDEDETEISRIERLTDGSYLVEPIISLSDLKEEIGVDLRVEDEQGPVDTLGGFIFHVHGRVPDKGDIIRHRDHRFEVVEMTGQRMDRIRLWSEPESGEE